MDGERRKPQDEYEQEKAWIEEFLAGDRSAFDNLALRYQDRVFNLCCRMIGDRQDAADCAQEVFVKVYRSLERFRFDSHFSTWIYTIAVNTCRNHLKSVAFRFWKRTASIDPPGEDEGSRETFEPADPAPSALDRLERKERETLVQKAVEALPRDSREVIILRDMEGFSYEDIARITGWNPGTVKSKLARARSRLQQELKEA